MDSEGAHPSSLIPYYHHKPDRAYLLQLKREVEIANEETVRKYGPLLPGGLPEQKKTKPKGPCSGLQGNLVPEVPTIEESDEMKLNQIAGAVALSMAVMVVECAAATTHEEAQPTGEIKASKTANVNLMAEAPVDHVPIESVADQLEPAYRKSFKQCMDASNGVTVAMRNCIGEEFAYQDKRLNVAYKRLHEALPPADWESLRGAQRKWLAERVGGCDVDDDMKGGTEEMLILADCELRKTAFRADELEALLKKQNH